MRRSLLLLFTPCIICVMSVHAQKKYVVRSPNKKIEFNLVIKPEGPLYSIRFEKTTLIDQSSLGLEMETGSFQKNLTVTNVTTRDTSEQYKLVVGKASTVRTHYRELCITLQQKDTKINIRLRIRAFDDGMAFRYEFPEQENYKSYVLLEENTRFRLTGNPLVTTLLLPSFTSSHEGMYSVIRYNDISNDTLMDMPSLFQFPGNIYMAITEAALSNYAGMYLEKKQGILSTQLSPLPKQSSVKVKALLPHHSPWRVFLIGDRIGTLFESNILTTLNEPSAIKDLSWIKPGKTTFPWWNGNITPDTSFTPGNNFETNKYYIDFCSRNGIEYHSVVEYGGHEWYTSDGTNFQPGPNTDITNPVPGLDMKQICDYAKTKSVAVRVWVHWAALYPKLDTAFALFEQWGLSGMMVDFMDRDDQEMVNIQEEILQKAAKHHLHVQFHGAYKPTGMHRTYPNEFTREGTLNYENNKWGQPLPPSHDLHIAYTRLLAGATDYHLGGFRSVSNTLYKVQYIRPLMTGTRSHMLSMYVILESYLGMLCDYPGAYENQDGFDFLKAVPCTWDETVVLNGSVNEYLTIARRKDTDWYIGTINNEVPRQFEISLSFLPEGNYTAEVYADDNENNPNSIKRKTITVTRTDHILTHLINGGGQAIRLIKQ